MRNTPVLPQPPRLELQEEEEMKAREVAAEALAALAPTAYVSIRQHTSAYVSIRQHTSA
jgi:hypothetical protein